MKSILLLLFFGLYLNSFSQRNLDSLDKANFRAVSLSGGYISKATIEKDSTIWLRADIRRDHRFFGYEKPGVSSRRLILFSIFTNDVENNPFGCTYGSYYDTNGLDDSLKLKFVSRIGNFIRAQLIKADTDRPLIADIFFENKWLKFAH
jgi:hypothetical protein